MELLDALLLIIIVAIVVIFLLRSTGAACSQCRSRPCRCREGFRGSLIGAHDPEHVKAQMHVERLRRARNVEPVDDFKDRHYGGEFTGTGKYAVSDPQQLEAAAQQAWSSATDAPMSGQFNPEYVGSDEVFQHYQPMPELNYQDALVDMLKIQAPNLEANHQAYVQENAGLYQGAMIADDFDEAAVMSNNRGHGIYAFRQSGTHQTPSTLQITEVTAADAAKHSTNFMLGI